MVKSREELALAEVAEPAPARGHVLIEVAAVGVGFMDVLARRGEYYDFPGPGAVPGVEVAGLVTEVGAETSEEWIGKEVLAVLPAFGGYAERAVADADRLFPLAGTGVDAAGAVALGVNAFVADIASHRAGIRAGERVLVLGAGGGIGVLATQAARARGAEVTVVTSSAERGARLRALGAAHVVDRTRSPLDDGDSYDVVVDTVAGPALGQNLHRLRPNGRYLLCGAAGGPPQPEALAALLTDFHRSPTLFAFSLNSVRPEDLQASWQRITAMLRDGSLAPVVDQRSPLTDADAALRRVESGTPFGKVVLLPR
ncbi:zinc-binding dehydrogenase [Streptomyces sp. NPDC004959]|uniref:quinone oxidoreductase family protein n=1 Tax=unclassified Streptomyces TaxID=2593676 RepID=UPI0004C73DF6|nr:zinc-binding dehydrogenase [Streptomyces sp. NRRL F-5630]